MSIGYVSKKRAKIKRMRKLKKKYKNFSCGTCAKRHFDYKFGPCKKRYQATNAGTLLVGYFEHCEKWKSDQKYVKT